MVHNGAGGGWRHGHVDRGLIQVMVGGHELASVMKRRRIGRATLVERCDRSPGTTWLPGDPATVPPSLLVLAAMSMTRR